MGSVHKMVHRMIISGLHRLDTIPTQIPHQVVFPQCGTQGDAKDSLRTSFIKDTHFLTLPRIFVSLSLNTIAASHCSLLLSFPMGFPIGCAEVIFPNLFLHTLNILSFLRNLVFLIFNFLGLSDFLETDVVWPNHTGGVTRTNDPSRSPSLSAVLIRELLPVTKFGNVASVVREEGCCCAVCLFEFSGEEEIRCLRNCRHIFHRSCVDRWIDHYQKTWPLCRTPFVPDYMLDDFNQRLWAASGVAEFYGDLTSSFWSLFLFLLFYFSFLLWGYGIMKMKCT